MLVAEKLPVSTMDTQNDIIRQRQTARRVNVRNAKIVILVGILLALVVCNVVVHACVIRQDHQLKYWQKMIDEKERELVKLRIEIAQLESFDRIQRIAQNELGMRDAGPMDCYLIKSAPELKKEVFKSDYVAKTPTNTGLWNKVSGWLGGLGRTMAKNP
ncbi:MAG TPA: cell division protein FtsL [Bacillota bacterium]|nr:cell division protein FtsL [Bacillota bacterium]HPT87190.1 cell division protein FtsL [Bacillota bacterium]